MRPGRNVGPTALDLLLIVLFAPSVIPAAILGGIFFVPPKRENRPRRWLIGCVLSVAVAAIAHFALAPAGWARFVLPTLAVGLVARILLEVRAKQSRAANAYNAEVIERLRNADRRPGR